MNFVMWQRSSWIQRRNPSTRVRVFTSTTTCHHAALLQHADVLPTLAKNISQESRVGERDKKLVFNVQASIIYAKWRRNMHVSHPLMLELNQELSQWVIKSYATQ
jgi:hypothetical protein